MAFTVSSLANTVFGNQRTIFLRITADGAAGDVTTGLDNIVGVSMCPQSLTTGGINVHMNAGLSGTSTAGQLAVTGVTSGDELIVTVFGS